MTVSSIVPVNNYTGNGSSTTFDFDFLIENESELVVTHKNINAGNETVLTLGIDYSINETGNRNGSYITFPLQTSSYNILSTEEMITLSLSLPIKQESEFENSANLNLSVLEWTFDYIVRILQILTRKVERAVKVQEGETTTPDELVNNLYTARSEAQSAAQNAVTEAQKAANSALEAKNASLVLNTKVNIDMDNITTAGINNIKEIIEVSSAMPIGTIYPLACTANYVPEGSLPCDGGEYSKEQFNDLWNNYLTATTPLLLTCTYDEYASDITAYGQCGKFAVDFVNNKFKVPTIKDGAYITQAKSDTELGKSYNESLPNLKGSYNSIIAKNGIVPSGAFSDSVASGTTRKYSLGESYTFDIGNILDFNASNSSSTYQDNAKVQGDNVRMRYFVVVATGSVNESQMNWSEWASGLQGKSNTDLSNLSETGKKAIDGQWVSAPYLLSSATDTGTYTIDLSSYLPNDNYTYEVILNIKTYHTTGCNVTVYSNDFPPFEFSSKTYMSDIGQYARSQANTFLIPVSQKQVLMKIGTANASENYLSMIAYRRVGTNV
jgi:hypothetical protein